MKQLLFATMLAFLASCGKNSPPSEDFDGYYREAVTQKVTPQYNQLGNNLGVDAYGDMLIVRLRDHSCSGCGFYDTVYISNVVPDPKYGVKGLGSTYFEVAMQARTCCDSVYGEGHFYPDSYGEMWVEIYLTNKTSQFVTANYGKFVRTHE